MENVAIEGDNEMKHVTANKLDVLMKIMFDYFYDVCHKNGMVSFLSLIYYCKY